MAIKDDPVVGAAETVKALTMFPVAVQKEVVGKVARKIAKEDILPAARTRVPFDIGALHDSLTVRAAKTKRGSGEIGASVTTREGLFAGETFYGGFQEYGWIHYKDGSFVEGQPFLRPSLYENPQAKARKFSELVKRMMPRIVAKIRKRAFKKEAFGQIGKREAARESVLGALGLGDD